MTMSERPAQRGLAASCNSRPTPCAGWRSSTAGSVAGTRAVGRACGRAPAATSPLTICLRPIGAAGVATGQMAVGSELTGQRSLFHVSADKLALLLKTVCPGGRCTDRR